MLEAAIVVARLMQYVGAAVLFGSSLFFVYAQVGPPPRWARRIIMAGAALLMAAALAGIAAQASLFAGSFERGLTGEAMGAVMGSMSLGKAAVVRALSAGLALAVLAARPWESAVVVLLGAVATGSLAWMGHGAATEGTLGWAHLASDVLHSLAAAAWIGALAMFLGLARTARDAPERALLHRALERFSGIGTVLVTLVVLTGLFNGWAILGGAGVAGLPGSPYGRLLLAKLALVAAMVAFAALNRFKLTPELARRGDDASLPALQRSVVLEAAAGFAILGLVAWLGTLDPHAPA